MHWVVNFAQLTYFFPDLETVGTVRQKEVNNVFVNYECQCTCWRYSKTKKKVKQTKYSKTNDEGDYRDCGFLISSTALLG